MADDDYDRPHHHIFNDEHTEHVDTIHVGPGWECHNDACPHDHVVVVALDDYRRLVVAARDRHPTNHQPSSPDPAARANDGWPRFVPDP